MILLGNSEIPNGEIVFKVGKKKEISHAVYQ